MQRKKVRVSERKRETGRERDCERERMEGGEKGKFSETHKNAHEDKPVLCIQLYPITDFLASSLCTQCHGYEDKQRLPLHRMCRNVLYCHQMTPWGQYMTYLL